MLNRQRESGISRSDTSQHRPRRKLTGKRLSPHSRSGRRRAARRNQKSWSAAIAAAMIWLRVSSSGGIGDAASVSVNAMDQRHWRRRQRSRSSLATSSEGPGPKGLEPFSVQGFFPRHPCRADRHGFRRGCSPAKLRSWSDNANRTTRHRRAVFPHLPNGSKVGVSVEPLSRGEFT